MPNIGIYVPDALDQRLRRLKDLGVEIPVSTVCQKGLEAAIVAEERALRGDRLTRLIARVSRTRTAAEQAQDDGEAVGRRWAEDVAALSEMRKALDIRDDMRKYEFNGVSGGRREDGSLFLVVSVDEDEPITYDVPDSVPQEFIGELASEGRLAPHADRAIWGFLEGACAVLAELEAALARKENGPTAFELMTAVTTAVSQRVLEDATKPAQKTPPKATAEGSEAVDVDPDTIPF